MSRHLVSGWHCRVALAVLCGGLLAGCSGWNPHAEGAGGKSSYQNTQDGYYRVRPGDSLHAIAFKFSLDWREIARLNGISSPYTIYPDQELLLTDPALQTGKAGTYQNSQAGVQSNASGNGTVVTAAPTSRSSSTTYDVPPPSGTAASSSVASTPEPEPASVSAPAAVPSPPTASSVSVASADPGKWLWPADGRIISNFKPNDPARKGIDIGGSEGQAVVASAAGEVVYSGSGLIGYGELVIIKHNEKLLSAYAHNQKRLVSEGQKVSAGERIANMGTNDRNQAMLHFEIRLNGNPQDPLKYLPGR